MFTLIILGILFLPFLVIGGGISIFWKKKRRLILRWCGVLYLITVLVMILGVGPYLMAWAVTHAGSRPPDLKLKDTPADFGVAYEDMVFEAQDSLRLKGWFIPPTRKNAVLLCTHGLFRTRVEMLVRAIAAVKAG